MLLFALAALSQFVSPVIDGQRSGDVRAIFSYEDFPPFLMRSEGSWLVYSRTTVRPDGSIQSCGAEISSGDRRLDDYTCKIIARRAKFRPARWGDGTPVHSVVRLPISWIITDRSPAGLARDLPMPDLEILVDKMPVGAAPRVDVMLAASADDSGKIHECAEFPPNRSDKEYKSYPDLVPLACRQLITDVRAIPPVGNDGKSARSIQTFSVRFTTNR